MREYVLVVLASVLCAFGATLIGLLLGMAIFGVGS